MSLAGGVNVTRSARMGASGIEGSEGGFTWPDDLPAPPASPARDNTVVEDRPAVLDELAAALVDLPPIGAWVIGRIVGSRTAYLARRGASFEVGHPATATEER